jgi:hypothetical protein
MNYVEKARLLHNDQYDYSLVESLPKRDTRVSIICRIHGVFEQSFHKHLCGDGCGKCDVERNASKRVNTAREKFVEKAKALHGDKYDYSNVNYVNAKERVVLICRIHGEFEQTPNKHLCGNGCKKCANELLSQTNMSKWEDYKEELVKIHGGKYDYSNVLWRGSDNDIVVTCMKHGDFTIRALDHKYGRGCKVCTKEGHIQYNKLDTSTFIKRANELWGDTYDYSKVEYTNSNIKVTIICKNHGEFLQTPANHMKYGCKKCGTESNTRNKQLRESCAVTFVEKSHRIHDHAYDYSKCLYTNAATKVVLTCNKHGDFQVTPNNHLRGKGCKKCGNEASGLSKRSDETEYIQSFRNVYGDKYDYSSVVWDGSSKPVVVLCKKHGAFSILPYLHRNGRECPKCTNQYSGISIQWLSYMEVKYSTAIQNALNTGEYSVPNTRYKVDGYSDSIRTIFEFHGDYWHGNPKLYDPDEMNVRVGTSYGELYKQTIYKTQRLRELGYTVIEVWEYDWKRLIDAICILQKIWRSKNNENETSAFKNY